MTKQEAINRIENHLRTHFRDLYPYTVIKEALFMGIEALKVQEPVKPYIDYDGQDVWRCGSCGATLFHLSHTQADENERNCVKFCRYCGKAVKWDE